MERMKTISQVRKYSNHRPKTDIQLLREQANLEVHEVASHAGVSKPTIYRLEQGRPPDIRSALRLAKFFETTVEALFGPFSGAENKHEN